MGSSCRCPAPTPGSVLRLKNPTTMGCQTEMVVVGVGGRSIMTQQILRPPSPLPLWMEPFPLDIRVSLAKERGPQGQPARARHGPQGAWHVSRHPLGHHISHPG